MTGTKPAGPGAARKKKTHLAKPFRPASSTSLPAMLVDGSDEVFRRVLFLTRLFSDRLATFRTAVAQTVGLTGNQYVILLATAHAQVEGGATVGEIARYALMHSSHVTTQTGALIRKGLVAKKPNGEDGRSVLLSLTPKGEQAMQRIATLRRAFNDAFFVGVKRGTLLDVAAFLEHVTANTEAALPLLEHAAPSAVAPAKRRKKAR